MRNNLLTLVLGLLASYTLLQAQVLQVDPAFHSPLTIRAAKINDLRLLADDKVLVGGDISSFGDTEVHHLIRLNENGSLDDSFNFVLEGDYQVKEVEMQSNGDLIILAQGHESATGMHIPNTLLIKTDPHGSILKSVLSYKFARFISVLPDNSVLIGGEKSEGGAYMNRFSPDLEEDNAFNNRLSFTGIVHDVKSYNNQLYVAGSFSAVNDVLIHAMVRLNMDGTVDRSFDPGFDAHHSIGSITIQPDGKILLGKTHGISINDSNSRGLTRLNNDGSVDTDFNPPSLRALRHITSEIFVNDNHLYLAALVYRNLIGRYELIRLKIDGTVDETFTPVEVDHVAAQDLKICVTPTDLLVNNTAFSGNEWGLSRFTNSGDHVNNYKPMPGRSGTLLTAEYTGEVLYVGGDFIVIDGHQTYGIARLDVDGAVDKYFTFEENHGQVEQVEQLDEEHIFVNSDKLYKVNMEGVIQNDFEFKPFKELSKIREFRLLPDGKIIAGNYPSLYRLKSDGSEDETFDIGTGISYSSSDYDFDVQGDKIVYGSPFSSLNGTPVNKLLRLNPDGSLDESFDIGEGPSGDILFVKVLENNDILVGGFFDTFDGVSLNDSYNVVKLNEDGAILPEFSKNLKHIFKPNIATAFGNWLFLGGGRHLDWINPDGTHTSITSMYGFVRFSALKAAIPKDNHSFFLVGSHIINGEQAPRILSKVNFNYVPIITRVDVPAFILAGDQLSISLDELILENAGNFKGNFSFNILEGENYTVNEHTIIPDTDFTGVLQVSVNFQDGLYSSETYTFPLEVLLTAPTALSKDKMPAGFTLYPNPADDFLFLKGSASERLDFSVSVYDLVGNQVLVTATLSAEGRDVAGIDTQNLKAGMYLLKVVQNSGKTETYKFYKSR